MNFCVCSFLQPLPSPTEVQYVEAYASPATKKVNRLYDAKSMFNIFIYGKWFVDVDDSLTSIEIMDSKMIFIM